jgi:H+/Cl- antiporter ClcA
MSGDTVIDWWSRWGKINLHFENMFSIIGILEIVAIIVFFYALAMPIILIVLGAIQIFHRLKKQQYFKAGLFTLLVPAVALFAFFSLTWSSILLMFGVDQLKEVIEHGDPAKSISMDYRIVFFLLFVISALTINFLFFIKLFLGNRPVSSKGKHVKKSKTRS